MAKTRGAEVTHLRSRLPGVHFIFCGALPWKAPAQESFLRSFRTKYKALPHLTRVQANIPLFIHW